MTRTVYIIGGGQPYREMFHAEGWEVVSTVLQADLVQFTGGEDVTPSLYGEEPHEATFCNPRRDQVEMKFFSVCMQSRTPMAGICRGGQFLNVMNGGKLWQDVNNHALAGTHEVIDIRTEEIFQVTSTHHQMMIPQQKANVIAVAFEADRRERIPARKNPRIDKKEPIKVLGKGAKDYEIIHYPTTKSLCFQPHPEFEGFNELRRRYFDYIEELLFTKPLEQPVEAKEEFTA